jgi:hypothetical protein
MSSSHVDTHELAPVMPATRSDDFDPGAGFMFCSESMILLCSNCGRGRSILSALSIVQRLRTAHPVLVAAMRVIQAIL